METPVRRSDSDLLVTRSDGEVVVLDRAASCYHHLNPLTTFVWERCDGETSRTVMAREVAGTFETEAPGELVDAALERLRAANLLKTSGGARGVA